MSSRHESETPVPFDPEGWVAAGLMPVLCILGLLSGRAGVDFAPGVVLVIAISAALLCILAGGTVFWMLFTAPPRRGSNGETYAPDLYGTSSLFRFLLSSPPLGLVLAIFALLGKPPISALGLPSAESLVDGSVVVWILAVALFAVSIFCLCRMLFATIKVARGYGDTNEIAAAGALAHFLFAATIILVVVLNF